MDKLLEVQHLKKYFKTGAGLLHAVDAVSFSIEQKKTLGVVGESGCGKSTLGRVILGLLDATDGSVRFNGKEITNVSARERFQLRREMQIVFQDPFSSLDPRMTVSDIIGEPLDVHKMYGSKKEREEKIRHLMSLVGLSSEHATRYAHEFSGGQRQRIGIARALAVDPKFIVCDEPVSALDVSIQAQVVNMFEDLQEQLGLTYLFIAHDLLVVKHISTRIAVMYLGKMIEIGPSNELYHHPIHPYTQSLLSAVPIPDPKIARANERIHLSGDVPSPLHMPSGCPFRTRCPRVTEKCAEVMPELKEMAPGHKVACHNV